MSRVASLSLALVYVGLTFQPTFALAADKPESSASNNYTVRDHRARSGGQGGVTISNSPVVRDHRKAPIVRDHRNAPVVRDHRDTSSSSGGTKVSNSPIVRDHRNPPIIRDHRTPARVVDPYAKSRRPGKAPPIVRPLDPGRGDGKVVVRDHRDPPIVRDHRDVPVVRDHRDTSNSSGGTKVTGSPTVRDHRNPPIIRDHRDAPIIRDHRTPTRIVDPFEKTRRPGKAPPIVRPIDPGRGDGKVVVRDHREGPIVRDHRNVPVVRDHRDTPYSSGGTTVTNTPIVRDHR
jgi:hypothetical protein